jgi:hypothetical protein
MGNWHTSSYSPNGSDCVEVRESPGVVDVRDTRNRESGHLSFPMLEWSAFVAEVRTGDL